MVEAQALTTQSVPTIMSPVSKDRGKSHRKKTKNVKKL